MKTRQGQGKKRKLYIKLTSKATEILNEILTNQMPACIKYLILQPSKFIPGMQGWLNIRKSERDKLEGWD